jgi:hypothetical protein
MTADVHTRAKELIVGGTSSAEEQRWLSEHLASCRECGGLLQRAQAVRTALRTVPVMADPNLVNATQRRVLRFASEQRERESNQFLIRVTIAVAAVLTWVSVPLLWQAAQWVGGFTPQPQLTAVLAFLLVGILPAVLAGAAALAARRGSGREQQQATIHWKGEL